MLKLDHIGDLLLAVSALMLLRKSFHDAQIVLLCAPWNEGLARRLGIADVVIGIPAFAPNSLDDLDVAAREQKWKKTIRRVEALDLGRFDLAIDLRRDEDTRELLKLIDARRFAGFGDHAVFGFLDIALAHARHGPAAAASHLLLGPTALDREQLHQGSAGSLHLTARTGRVTLSIATDACWSPAQDGKPDSRMLGVALRSVHVQPAAADPGHVALPVELPRSSMSFGPGWLAWEPWGRWSNLDEASLAITFPLERTETQLLLNVQGYTSPSHPRSVVTVAGGGDRITQVFEAGDEPATIRLPGYAELAATVTRSEPYLLRGGRYAGTLRLELADVAGWIPLTLTVRGAQMNHVIARLQLPARLNEAGALAFPFEVELKDSAEPIVVEIEAERADVERKLAIKSVELDWLQGKLPELPTTHMENQLLDLAAMVAVRLAPTLARDAGEIAARLSRPRRGSTATRARWRLRRLRRGTWPWQRRAVRLIGIGVGANKETKRWPQAHFVELCRRLLAQEDVRLVLFGGPQEAEDAAGLAAALDAGDRVLDLVAASRIEDLGELLAELDGFVGLDTGTTHFAGRVGLRTVALFGAAHDPREWGPAGERSGWVATAPPCAGCSFSLASQCAIGVACMSELTPDTVWPTVERQLFGPIRDKGAA